MVDDYNREALAIEVDLSLPSVRVVRVLERIVAWRGYPIKIRMDNGPEFISVTLADWADKHGIQLEFIKPESQLRTRMLSGLIGLIERSSEYVCVQTIIRSKRNNRQLG